MDSKKVDARLETRVSQKGNTYTAVFIKITPTYEKTVFLSPAEIELLKAQGIKAEVR